MSVVFLTDSILTTIQDQGRENFRRFGINPGGAMDKTALRLANILLANDENEAALEIHFPAPKIRFKQPAIICLAGADFDAHLNDVKIENWRAVFAESESILTFKRKIFGNRIYLAVQNGFEVESWLSSCSTNLKAKTGGFNGRKITKGDELFFKKSDSKCVKLNFKTSKSLVPNYSSFPTVRVIEGGEFERLSAESRTNFTSQNFKIRHDSDRMGFRLEGEKLTLNEKVELVSSAVNFGTIQLLPDGQLIVLMADHQTTGGYPRIANIITHDLPIVAQLGSNDRLNFSLVTIGEAEKLFTQLEIELNYLKYAAKYKFS